MQGKRWGGEVVGGLDKSELKKRFKISCLKKNVAKK